MTTIKETTQPTDRSILINRFMYAAFVILSLYDLLAHNDYANGMSNLGIALIFDPFDQRIAWQQRPLYQRIWLFVHVGVVLILLAFLGYTSLVG